jgi:hypothetical protein
MIADYLTLAERQKIRPTFFHSLPYLLVSKAKAYLENGWVWVEADDWLLFPGMLVQMGKGLAPYPHDKVWIYTTFNEKNKPPIMLSEFVFLDYEYIFDPNSFKDLSGGSWNVYRKNIRKWPKSHQKWVYTDKFNQNSILKLLLEWVDAKSETIKDFPFIWSYFNRTSASLISLGIYIKVLKDENNEIVAINTWDVNWKFVNFRFCITKPGEDYLQEFTRYLFYTDPDVLKWEMLVNDGGALDNPGLEKFKDKMNPKEKNLMYSLINTKQDEKE